MYVFKHFIGALANPLLAATVTAVLALLCRLLERGKWGLALSACAIAVADLGSTPVIGDALLWPLERQ